MLSMRFYFLLHCDRMRVPLSALAFPKAEISWIDFPYAHKTVGVNVTLKINLTIVGFCTFFADILC